MRRVRISDMVQFFPYRIPFPSISLNDHLTSALDEITITLPNPQWQHDNPTLQLKDHNKLAIQIVATILRRLTSIPSLQLSSPLLKIPLPKPSIPQQHLPHVKHPTPVSLPRVQQKNYCTTMHPHMRLKHRAKTLPNVKPYASSIIHRLLHIYNKQAGKKETLRPLLKNDLTNPIWTKASSNEYGRLMNGNDACILGTNTMEPIALHDIPAHRQVTYGSMVCDH